MAYLLCCVGFSGQCVPAASALSGAGSFSEKLSAMSESSSLSNPRENPDRYDSEEASLRGGFSSSSAFSSSGSSASESSSDLDDSDQSSGDYTSSSSGESETDSDSSESSNERRLSSDDANDEDLDFEAKHAKALKKWGVTTEESTKNKTAKTKVKKQARTEPARDGGGEGGVRESVLRRSWAEEVEGLSEDEILVKLRELTASRQKRSAERTELLRQAQTHAKERSMKRVYIEALRAIINIGLDLSASICLSVSQWTTLANDIIVLYCELCAEGELTFSSNEGSPAAAVAGYVDCLQTNLTKGIKNCDSYSEEYKERLGLLPLLHAILILNHAYMVSAHSSSSLVGRYLVSSIAQTYYMTDIVAARRWESVSVLIPPECKQALAAHMTYNVSTMEEKNSAWVKRVTDDVVRRDLPEVEITFACLCYYIQNAAINGRLDEARELMHSTALYDLAQNLDAHEQIHYNRTICQIGLAAFREGNFQLASTYLSDICATNKQRELLAQGMSSLGGGGRNDPRMTDSGRTEQEKIERRRLLPAYLHLNLDLIESASNIYSILNSRSVRFRRILEYTEKSFVPPESSREIVFACGRKLHNGEYSEACRLIKTLKFWQTYDDGAVNSSGTAESVQRKIFEKFREIALICYFQRYAQVYQSFSAANLAKMFDLTTSEVYALVSRMILKKEVNASWDAQGEILYIQQNLTTPLQSLTHTVLKNIDTLFGPPVA